MLSTRHVFFGIFPQTTTTTTRETKNATLRQPTINCCITLCYCLHQEGEGGSNTTWTCAWTEREHPGRRADPARSVLHHATSTYRYFITGGEQGCLPRHRNTRHAPSVSSVNHHNLPIHADQAGHESPPTTRLLL